MGKAGAMARQHSRESGAGCAHHWVIESPSGPTSRGLCTLCGAEREFPNYAQFPSGRDIRFKVRGRHDAGTPH